MGRTNQQQKGKCREAMKIELRNKTKEFNVFDCPGGLWTHIIIIEIEKKSFSVIVLTAAKSFIAKKGRL